MNQTSCPTCYHPSQIAVEGAARYRVCLYCDRVIGPAEDNEGAVPVVKKKRAGQRTRAIRESEEGIQQRIVEALRLHGYVVFVTSEHRRVQRCAKCGTWQHWTGGRGCSEGIPDLFITRPEWEGWWRGQEVKAPDGRLSPTQRAYVDGAYYPVVHDEHESLADLKGRRLTSNGCPQ